MANVREDQNWNKLIAKLEQSKCSRPSNQKDEEEKKEPAPITDSFADQILEKHLNFERLFDRSGNLRPEPPQGVINFLSTDGQQDV